MCSVVFGIGCGCDQHFGDEDGDWDKEWGDSMEMGISFAGIMRYAGIGWGWGKCLRRWLRWVQNHVLVQNSYCTVSGGRWLVRRRWGCRTFVIAHCRLSSVKWRRQVRRCRRRVGVRTLWAQCSAHSCHRWVDVASTDTMRASLNSL